MHSFIDQLHRQIILPKFPERIVSLVPSQTELLYDLGLGDKVIGITKFCIHPEAWFKTKTRIGGTKTIHIERVLSLHPDLIIANKEENVKEQIDMLAIHAPVWVSDVNTLEEAYNMITAIGTLTNTSSKAIKLVEEIKKAFAELRQATQQLTIPVSCAYLIWKDPYMTVGRDTFIHAMLSECGLQNVFADRERYPSITLSELKNLQCQFILLSSEPYPFKEKHIMEIQEALPQAKVLLVDGEMFSWYGSRLVKAAAYLKDLVQANC